MSVPSGALPGLPNPRLPLVGLVMSSGSGDGDQNGRTESDFGEVYTGFPLLQDAGTRIIGDNTELESHAESLCCCVHLLCLSLAELCR
jgi:hypothetical protein